MLKRRASLLHFLRILEAYWQAGVLGELLTDQSNLHKVIYGTRWCYFLYFAVYTTNNGSYMPSRRLQLRWLDTPLQLTYFVIRQ